MWTLYHLCYLTVMCVYVCVCACGGRVQVAIVESGALLDLKRLLQVKENPDIQCHAAGTLRNLGAENQAQVSLVFFPMACLEEPSPDFCPPPPPTGYIGCGMPGGIGQGSSGL